jgi:hypothetical protein
MNSSKRNENDAISIQRRLRETNDHLNLSSTME